MQNAINTRHISVKEGSLLCYQLGLPRSIKSIRRWCAKRDIEAEKRQTSHGEKWFIHQESLEIKIKEELEFLKYSEKAPELLQQPSGHGADASGHERLRPDTSEQETDTSRGAKIRDLKDQILLLKNDIKWRDQLLKGQKKTNETLMDEIKGQSRYIGHLETNVLRLGETPDQTFLRAPVPNSSLSRDADTSAETVTPEFIANEEPHPNQSDLYTG